MDKELSIIKKSPLFGGVEEKEIGQMLNCLSVVKRDYAKNEIILHSGDSINSVIMVLSGCVHIVSDDFWGNRNIIAEAVPGDVFAESYACAQNRELEVSALAAEDAKVMFMDIGRFMTTCSSACAFHARLIRNLLSVLAQKNIMMYEKLTHLTQRSTRGKLLSYLSEESKKQGSASFDIPFNRQQLADYLSVDRSAMSNELSKMRDEGILSFEKNHFRLMV
jgi:CRP-like cAMP-binding protein